MVVGYEQRGRQRVRARLAMASEAPALAPAALHGLAGDVVRSVEPLTEASPAAMLVTLLVAFAAMVGRTAFVTVGSARHYPILFATIVGDSARARKGTSKAAIMPVLLEAGPDVAPFLQDRVLAGIASGEALVQAAASGGQAMPEVAGEAPAADDQRLWVVEEEYARLLTVAGRSDSILSSVLRQAWDGATLENRTKRNRLRADRAHVCVLGHVTRYDLDRISAADIGNGSANRFLYVYSRRTRLLPTPGRLDEESIREFGERLMKALDAARHTDEVARTPAFLRAWDDLYFEVESQTGGGPLYEQLTARAAPHILRLALVYALLDGSSVLDVLHLEAAAALWDYCEATVAHVWGMTLGDARSDKLYNALLEAGDAGLSRSQINKLFSNNLDATVIDSLTRSLIDRGLAAQERRPTAGRPSEVLVRLPTT
jgi:hypothetical protein